MSAPENRPAPLDRPDLVFGLLMLAGAVIVFVQAMALPPSPYDPLGPGAFPRTLSATLGVLSLVLIGRVLLRRQVGRSETSLVHGVEEGVAVPLGRYLLALALCAMTLGYAALLLFTDLPFLLLTIAYIALLGVALSRRTARDLLTAVAVGVVLGVAIDLLFTRLLLITLP